MLCVLILLIPFTRLHMPQELPYESQQHDEFVVGGTGIKFKMVKYHEHSVQESYEPFPFNLCP